MSFAKDFFNRLDRFGVKSAVTGRLGARDDWIKGLRKPVQAGGAPRFRA
jgi:hypothetical protein